MRRRAITVRCTTGLSAHQFAELVTRTLGGYLITAEEVRPELRLRPGDGTP